MTRLRRYCRALLGGSLALGGMAAVSVVSGSIAATPAAAATPPAWTAYVVSNSTDAVVPVNTATHAVGAPITVGSGPSAIAIAPDGATAYVADEGTTNTSPGFVTPIDLSTNTAGTAIPVGSGPDAVAITPDGGTAYVGNYNDSTITPVNLATDSAGTPIPVGGAPTSIAIAPDGTTAYVGRAYEAGIQLDLTTNTVGSGVSPSGFTSAISPDGATVFATNPQYNGVNVFDTATASGTTVGALNSPEGVAVTPDGSTAYVAYHPFTGTTGALLPIPLADPNTPGAPIDLGIHSAFAVAVTPDGSTAFVTDLTGGDVVPVDLATGTAGAPIPLGSAGANPFAIAITPDQAPEAHLHVTIDGGLTDTFDASASSVAYGTIASYAWNFGDGATETTTTPVVSHTYANAGSTPVATVTETSSTGTSTGEVFTGQTASSRGGPQATAGVSVFLNALQQGSYPSVSTVSPNTGPTSGPTPVTITGTFPLAATQPGAVAEVTVGGVEATDVTVHSTTTVTAILPAHPAGVDDIVVTMAYGAATFGSSAVTPADQFTYSASIPVVVTDCTSSACQIPAAQYGPATLTTTASADCTACTVTTSLGEAVPTTGSSPGTCPNGMSYLQAQAYINESEASTNGSVLSAEYVNTFQGLAYAVSTVCAEVTAVPGAAARSAAAQGESAAPVVGQNIVVKKCAKKAVAPCVRSVVVNGNSVGTTVLLPVNESITLTVGPQKETIKKLAPKKGAAVGSAVTITGTNLTQVTAVYIDGDPVGGRLVGGVQATIVSATAKKLVVTVPPGASTGPVTLLGPSGAVTSSSNLTVT
jgi:DNA-binding beta-propeller fold protein YncE